jgi:hypothetical protein
MSDLPLTSNFVGRPENEIIEAILIKSGGGRTDEESLILYRQEARTLIEYIAKSDKTRAMLERLSPAHVPVIIAPVKKDGPGAAAKYTSFDDREIVTVDPAFPFENKAASLGHELRHADQMQSPLLKKILREGWRSLEERKIFILILEADAYAFMVHEAFVRKNPREWEVVRQRYPEFSTAYENAVLEDSQNAYNGCAQAAVFMSFMNCEAYTQAHEKEIIDHLERNAESLIRRRQFGSPIAIEDVLLALPHNNYINLLDLDFSKYANLTAEGALRAQAIWARTVSPLNVNGPELP